MREFLVDARYARFIESRLALDLAEVQRDKDRRGDDHPGVRALATVPDELIDQQAKGTLAIRVGANDSTEAATEILFAAGVIP